MYSHVNSQNIGIGTTSPTAKLEVSGDLILQSSSLIISEGNTIDLDVNTDKFNHYDISGPTSNFQISGILAAENDRIVTLYNRSGHSLEIYNEDVNVIVTDRIITGTGSTLTIYSGGSVTLRYSGLLEKWEVIASHYSSLNFFGSTNELPFSALILSETEQNQNLLNSNFILEGALSLNISKVNNGAYNWHFPPSTINAPSPRSEHTAIYDGTNMLLWGGYNEITNSYMSDGRIYEPQTDTWTTIPTAPILARSLHTAVWTGDEMVLWGGINELNAISNGAKYKPASKTWTTLSNTNAPTSRFNHTAVWTGDKMLVFGGRLAGVVFRNDHKSYTPLSDTWSNISDVNAPLPRINHSAVWTGEKMIIFGGKLVDGTITNTGGIYDPQTDSWTTMSTVGAPPNGLSEHTVVWTGTEMITFGGRKNGNNIENNFYKYDFINDSWTQGSNIDKPLATINHTAVWTGDKMIVYGGFDDIGGVYDPVNNIWVNSNITNNLNFSKHTAIWTGDSMIVSGTSETQILKKNFSSPKNKVLYLYKKM